MLRVGGHVIDGKPLSLSYGVVESRYGGRGPHVAGGQISDRLWHVDAAHPLTRGESTMWMHPIDGAFIYLFILQLSIVFLYSPLFCP